MIKKCNKNLLLAVAFFTIFLASFLILHFQQKSTIVIYSSNHYLNFGEKLALTQRILSENEIQAQLILQKISALFPLGTFTHVDNTTSAKNSRASIVNHRQKYCVGETLIVQIEMFDHLGNRKTYGGDFIKARMFSPDLKAGASGRIEDFNNGTYHVYFTLFWAGRVSVSLVLHHPSEAASALWRARNQDYGLIYFVGTFGNGTHDAKSECGFKLNTDKEICEYRKKEDEAFYCIKPKSFHCKSLINLQSFNKAHSFLSQVERSILARTNIAIEIPKAFDSVDVYTCTTTSPKHLEQCKIGMKSPVPSGFVFQDTWRPVFCNITPQNQIHTCLKDKMIYLLGDSTIRQWYYYIVKTFEGLKDFNLYRPGLESMLLAVDLQRNTLLQWKKHGHPFVASKFYLVKDDQYLTEQIDQLPGGSNYVIVLCLGQHFRPFPIHLFIKRVINVHKALQNLFLRSPDTKVVIKLENIRERSSDPERLSDFYGYVHNMIVKDIFGDLHVAVVDAWDMTIAYNIDDVHAPENVIRQQVNMFLTYIC